MSPRQKQGLATSMIVIALLLALVPVITSYAETIAYIYTRKAGHT